MLLVLGRPRLRCRLAPLDRSAFAEQHDQRREVVVEGGQLVGDPESFKDPETADYVGIGVHCAKGSAFCADASAVKYGQTAPTP